MGEDTAAAADCPLPPGEGLTRVCMDVLQGVFTLTLALSHQGRGDIAEVTYPCQGRGGRDGVLPGWAGWMGWTGFVCYWPSLMKSATRSAIMMMVALVLARTISGITEESITRRFSRP